MLASLNLDSSLQAADQQQVHMTSPSDNSPSSLTKRMMNKASNLLNPASATDRDGQLSPTPHSSSQGGSGHRRRGSDVSASIGHLVSRAKSVTSKAGRRQKGRTRSDASSDRPAFHRSAPGDRPSFRHEEYPRSPSTELLDVNGSDQAGGEADDDLKVPALLQQGTPMRKISAKKNKTIVCRLDADLGQILWESKKSGISECAFVSNSSIVPDCGLRSVTIENIKEIRSGEETRFYREQLNYASSYEERWITIIYISDGKYKTLHVVPFTDDVFQMWDSTLRRLYSLRQDLMSGLGNMERRQMVWERHYWKGADSSQDERLSFEEVEMMCKRLNIKTPRSDLLNRFMVSVTSSPDIY